MSDVQARVARWHEQLLSAALDQRSTHPEFRFNLRTRSAGGADRLAQRYWFTGNDHYLFFAPFVPHDQHNKTRTIGFVLNFDDEGSVERCYLEIVFGSTADTHLRATHQAIVKALGPFKQVRVGKFQKAYAATDPGAAFRTFLEQDLPQIDRLLESRGVADHFRISESAFREMLERVQGYRGDSPSERPPAPKPGNRRSIKWRGEAITREDVVAAFGRTAPSAWRDLPGLEPYWVVRVADAEKPAKAVFRAIPQVGTASFTSQLARRKLERLGFECRDSRTAPMTAVSPGPSTDSTEKVAAGPRQDLVRKSDPAPYKPIRRADAMKNQKYSVNQYLVESLLNWVKSGEIAIPEIQRPFVWNASRVRDLLDSLYRGYPVGYVIAWRNPDVRTKDGRTAGGKKILIDGQQRVTALRAAILGETVVDKHYRKGRIVIAFNPIEQVFEVSNPAIQKNSQWIADISPLVSGKEGLLRAHRMYAKANPAVDPDDIEKALTSLINISKRQIGMIELEHDLDIEEVTEIFIRINSKGVVLSQADFAMSKIASEEKLDGPNLRKAIDYFCHMAIAPEIHDAVVANDREFAQTDYYKAIRWLRAERDDLYDPTYVDVMRVAFTSEFERGRLADLVSLLSGRDFERRVYEEEIAQDSFKRLGKGFLRLANETEFKRFLMIIRSAGFIEPHMIRSRNAMNFAYIVYLKLREGGRPANEIERFVRRWFVMTVLTERASGSFESQFEADIKAIASRDFAEFLGTVEAGQLSDAFWSVSMVEALNKSTTNSPLFWAYIAAQVKGKDPGFLSRDITVADLVSVRGDIHHVFPKAYLKQKGMGRKQYNQIANMAYMQTEINIAIGTKAPKAYFSVLSGQAAGARKRYGNIDSAETLASNLRAHAMPDGVADMDAGDYESFLEQRRVLMASKMRRYYESL